MEYKWNKRKILEMLEKYEKLVKLQGIFTQDNINGIKVLNIFLKDYNLFNEDESKRINKLLEKVNSENGSVGLEDKHSNEILLFSNYFIDLAYFFEFDYYSKLKKLVPIKVNIQSEKSLVGITFDFINSLGKEFHEMNKEILKNESLWIEGGVNTIGKCNGYHHKFDTLGYIKTVEVVDVLTMATLAHEIGHEYETILLDQNKRDELSNGFREITSTLFEYFLFEYLYDKGYITLKDYKYLILQNLHHIYIDSFEYRQGLNLYYIFYQEGVNTLEDLENYDVSKFSIPKDKSVKEIKNHMIELSLYNPKEDLMYANNRIFAYLIFKNSKLNNIKASDSINKYLKITDKEGFLESLNYFGISIETMREFNGYIKELIEDTNNLADQLGIIKKDNKIKVKK